MLVHPELLPDVLALLIPALVVSSLAWWRSAIRTRRLTLDLKRTSSEVRKLRAENEIQRFGHSGRWATLRAQYEQTDLLYRSEQELATRLADFVEEAPVTLCRRSRTMAATKSPYGVVYDGERCQPSRIKARIDEMKILNPDLGPGTVPSVDRSAESMSSRTGAAA